MASLMTALSSVKRLALNRERLIEFGRKRAKEGWPRNVGHRLSFIRTIITHAAGDPGMAGYRNRAGKDDSAASPDKATFSGLHCSTTLHTIQE
jgi:hypothetical protein